MTIIIAALATWQIVEIWRHSLLLAPIRAITEMWTGKIGELLSCPFCLSTWVGMLCLIMLQVQDQGLAGLSAGLVVKAFAVARLANLGNDFFKQWTLTPKVNFDYDERWEDGDSVG